MLNTQTWNAIKIYIPRSKYDLKQDADSKIGPANSQRLSTKCIKKPKLFPNRDHHAQLTIIFAKADAERNFCGLPF